MGINCFVKKEETNWSQIGVQDKYKSNREVERFKASLVTKGYK